MILLAFFQIVLRNFFATGIDWGDALVRYLVIWVAFIGAAIATKEGKHIKIDILSRWITEAGSIWIQTISHLFSTIICGLLTLAAITFIGFEIEMGSAAFFKFPAWIPELIIPITFELMTLRFAFHFLDAILKILIRIRRN